MLEKMSRERMEKVHTIGADLIDTDKSSNVMFDVKH